MAEGHSIKTNRDVMNPRGGWTPTRLIVWIGCVLSVLALVTVLTGSTLAVRQPVAAMASGGNESGTDKDDWESCKTVSSSWWMAPLPEAGQPQIAMSGTSMAPVQDSCADEPAEPGAELDE